MKRTTSSFLALVTLAGFLTGRLLRFLDVWVVGSYYEIEGYLIGNLGLAPWSSRYRWWRRISRSA